MRRDLSKPISSASSFETPVCGGLLRMRDRDFDRLISRSSSFETALRASSG